MIRFGFGVLAVSMVLNGCQTKPTVAVSPPDNSALALFWSSPSTWGGTVPTANTQVVIPVGKRIVLDVSTTVKNITVLGTLEVKDTPLELQTDYIAVQGALRLGSAINPIGSKITITLKGNPAENIMNMGSRGILVMGGRLEIYGKAPKVAWTKLADNSPSGATNLSLLENTGWLAGDQLVIAPTDFYNDGNFQKSPITEQGEVQSTTGSSIALKTALQGARWGKLQYATESGMSLTQGSLTLPNMTARDTGGTTIPTVLDERAEVGNLSRNIVIQSADDTQWQQQRYGAQVMVMGATSQVYLDGVELRRVGQAGKFGRYPVHFHNLSYDTTGKELSDATATLKNSSIWNSAQRCVVIHGSNGVKIQNNICYDIKGHALFLEDGVERRNVLENNLVLKVRPPLFGSTAPSTCPNQMVYGNSPERNCALLQHERRDGQPSGFWLVNPDNIVRGNAVADIDGHGYWLAYPKAPMGSNESVSLNGINASPINLPFGVFENNVAHSLSDSGVFIDNGPKDSEIGETDGTKYAPTPNGVPFDYQNGLRFTLSKVTTYKTGAYWGGGGGIWNRNTNPNFLEWVSADHQGGWFAGAGDNGLIARSLIIGQSLNTGVPRASQQPLAALASYHSTFDMTQNVVIGFPFVEGTENNSSGVFMTGDYYITAVDKGLVRNPDNKLIDSAPGRRVQPFTTENWTLAGALWDAHGYWGAKGNYWVYDQPFFTTGTSCTQVVPAGKNGSSCAGPYYAVGDYITDFDTERYGFKHPIEVTRVDTSGSSLGVWRVGDGNTAPKLGNMRHFAGVKDGRFILRFPKRSGSGYEIPTRFEATVGNFLQPTDQMLLGVAFNGAQNPTLKLANGDETRSINVGGANLGAVQNDPSGKTYYFDRASNMIWVKLVGGLRHTPDTQNPNSDYELYQSMRLEIQ